MIKGCLFCDENINENSSYLKFFLLSTISLKKFELRKKIFFDVRSAKSKKCPTKKINKTSFNKVFTYFSVNKVPNQINNKSDN